MEGRIEVNRGGNNPIGQSGVGFIVVPDDNTRQQYIENCYRTSTVTINGGYGYGYISAVKILPDVLQHIRFPMSSKERGTSVLWLRENFSNRPVVIGIISEAGYANLLKENQSRYVQEIDGKIVEIFQDANTATLNINVLGDKNNPANVNVKVSSENDDSVVNVESDGEINVSSNKITAIARELFQVNVKDSDDENLIELCCNKDETKFKDHYGNEINIDSNNVNIVVEKEFKINGGGEQMVLGNKLVDLMNEILDAIKQITVMTPVGTSSVPVNASSFILAQEKLKNILSNVSKTD